MDFFLTKFTVLVKKFPFLVFIVILTLSILSLFYAIGIKFDRKWVTINLLSEKLEEVREYNKISKIIPSEELLVINISAKKNENFENTLAWVIKIGDDLSKSHYVTYPMRTFREFNSREFDEFYLKYGILFMDEGAIKSLDEKLSQKRMKKNLKAESFGLLSYFNPLFWISKNDPLHLYSFLKRIKNERALNLNGDFVEGVFVTNDKREFYLFADANVAIDDLENATSLVNELEKIRDKFAKEAEIDVKYSGSNIIALNNYLAIKRDIFVTGIISFLSVVILFYLFFRSFFILIASIFCLLSSQIFTIALTRLIFGELNFGTSIFVAVIFGLGIDYSTHFFYHYLDEIKKGTKLIESLSITIRNGGLGIITCTLTTALSFFSLSFAEHKGFFQFGIVTGIGILINCLVVLIAVPALILLFKYQPKKIYEGKFFNLGKFCSFALREPLFIAIFSLFLLIFCAIPIYKLKYENDIWKLFAKGFGHGEILYNLSQRIGFNPQSIDIILAGNDVESVLKKGYILDDIVKKFKRKKYIAYYDSITNYLPEKSKQMSLIKMVNGLPNLKPEVFETRYYALSKCGRENKTFLCNDYPETIKESLSNRDLITADSLKDLMPSFSVDKYLGRLDESYILKVKIFPKRAYDSPYKIKEMRAKLKELFPTDLVSGTTVLFNKLDEIILHDAKVIPPIVILCCFVLVLLQLRSLKLSIIAFIPLIAGIILTFGTIAIFGFKLNFMNLASIPLIIGMGVDNSIHLLNRIKKEGNIEIAVTLSSKGIVLASVTTVAGFASLFFANFVGFGSFAFSTSIGILTSMLFSIFVLPVICKYFLFRRVIGQFSK